MTCRGLLGGRLIELPICSTTSDSLASSTEESFHVVEIVDVLLRLLLRLVVLLSVVNFLMANLVLLLLTVVIPESGLRIVALTILLQRLDLIF